MLQMRCCLFTDAFGILLSFLQPINKVKDASGYKNVLIDHVKGVLIYDG